METEIVDRNKLIEKVAIALYTNNCGTEDNWRWETTSALGREYYRSQAKIILPIIEAEVKAERKKCGQIVETVFNMPIEGDEVTFIVCSLMKEVKKLIENPIV